MTKNILLGNGQVIEMDFEQVINQFNGLVIKVIKRYRGINYTEDDMQEGYMALWEAFTTYNETHCFSTHATWRLRKAFAKIVTHETSPVRDKTGKEFINMEFDLGDGHCVGDMLEDVTSNFEDSIMEKGFIEYIKNNLTEPEMDLLAYNLGYVKIKDIAEKYSIGKSGVTNRNAKFKIKLEKLIREYNL